MSVFGPASDNREDPSGSHRPLIGRQAEIRIRGSSYLALRDVICIARGDILHLRGRLPSHYLKQVAQEIAAGVEGVRHVCNGIEVSVRRGRGRVGRRSEAHDTDLVELTKGIVGGEDSLPSSNP